VLVNREKISMTCAALIGLTHESRPGVEEDYQKSVCQSVWPSLASGGVCCPILSTEKSRPPLFIGVPTRFGASPLFSVIRNQQVLGSSPSAGSNCFNNFRNQAAEGLCKLVTTGHHLLSVTGCRSGFFGGIVRVGSREGRIESVHITPVGAG
jgi:hypothetical protein